MPSRCASACIPVLSWAKNEEHETAGLVAQGLDASSVTLGVSGTGGGYNGPSISPRLGHLYRHRRSGASPGAYCP